MSQVPGSWAQDVILGFSPDAGDKIAFATGFKFQALQGVHDLGDIERLEESLTELVSDFDKAKEEADGTLYDYGYVIEGYREGFEGGDNYVSTRILTSEGLSELLETPDGGTDELPVFPIVEIPEIPELPSNPDGGGESGSGSGSNGGGNYEPDSGDDHLADAHLESSPGDVTLIEDQYIPPSVRPEEPDPSDDLTPPAVDIDPEVNDLRVKSMVVTPPDGLFNISNNAFNEIAGNGQPAHIYGTSNNGKITGINNTVVQYGRDGDDYLYGSRKEDILSGDAGDDVLQAGHCEDSLLGGRGYDVLYGGKGSDIMTGGSGKDVFVLSQGNDQINDFTIGEDDIGLVHALDLKFADTSKGMRISGNDGVNTLIKGVSTDECLENFPNDLASTPVVQVELF